jgi:hypothetical protein
VKISKETAKIEKLLYYDLINSDFDKNFRKCSFHSFLDGDHMLVRKRHLNVVLVQNWLKIAVVDLKTLT